MHKISRLQIYFALALALLIQLTVLDHIKIFGAKPALMLTLVIFFGLFLGRGMGLEIGLAAGFASDLFTLDLLGINALIFALTGFLAGMLGAQLSRESKRTQGLTVLILTALAMILHFIIVSMLSRWSYLDLDEYIIGSAIPTSVYTAAVSIPVFFKLSSVYDLDRREEYL